MNSVRELIKLTKYTEEQFLIMLRRYGLKKLPWEALAMERAPKDLIDAIQAFMRFPSDLQIHKNRHVKRNQKEFPALFAIFGKCRRQYKGPEWFLNSRSANSLSDLKQLQRRLASELNQPS
jgi:hypothetical protein